jgi:hypothetical protein
MDKENLSVSFRKLLELDITNNTKSWEPVIRNNWAIKFSIYKENILLMFVSVFTGETIIRYYNNEDEACEFINYILHNDATKFLSNNPA